jgi:hypothetical protein
VTACSVIRQIKEPHELSMHQHRHSESEQLQGACTTHTTFLTGKLDPSIPVFTLPPSSTDAGPDPGPAAYRSSGGMVIDVSVGSMPCICGRMRTNDLNGGKEEEGEAKLVAASPSQYYLSSPSPHSVDGINCRPVSKVLPNQVVRSVLFSVARRPVFCGLPSQPSLNSVDVAFAGSVQYLFG